MTTTFRPATYDHDAKTLRNMVKGDKYVAHFAHVGYCNRARFQAGHVIIAEHDGVVAGFAVLSYLKTRHQTKINILCVDPARRSEGIGTALVDYVASTQPYPILMLNVKTSNIRAIKFYEREGFKIVGYIEKDDCHTMQKTVKRGTLL